MSLRGGLKWYNRPNLAAGAMGSTVIWGTPVSTALQSGPAAPAKMEAKNKWGADVPRPALTEFTLFDMVRREV